LDLVSIALVVHGWENSRQNIRIYCDVSTPGLLLKNSILQLSAVFEGIRNFYPAVRDCSNRVVPSYVERVYVDRASFVKKGELLVQLSAPEMMAHIAQAKAQLTSAESDEAQAEAQWAAAQSTYTRTQEAGKTPAAIAANDIVQAKAQTDAAQSLARSRQRTVESLKSNLKSRQDLAYYLHVTAPFDGVISTRFVHPGALVGPGADTALLQLDQISHLRLAIAVPEADVAGIAKGSRVNFKVPAYPDRTFSGVVVRPAYALDMKTRTMPVELDVANPQHLLAPGMYPTVLWPIERRKAFLMVPLQAS
jgi:RND family efflux transporter MFP subunit